LKDGPELVVAHMVDADSVAACRIPRRDLALYGPRLRSGP
jgi:hypothetical protein